MKKLCFALFTLLVFYYGTHPYANTLEATCPRPPDYSSTSKHINVFGNAPYGLDPATGRDKSTPFRAALAHRLGRGKPVSVCWYERGPD